MRTKARIIVISVALAALALGATACGGGSEQRPGRNGSATSAPATSAPDTSASSALATSSPTTAPSSLASILTDAYRTETKALATYRNAVTALGPVGPFPNVIASEEQHVATVGGLLTRYGVPTPTGAAGLPSPSTLTAACGLGVQTEQVAIAFYAQQLANVSAYADVTAAFENLRSAAQDSHLPAFEHCA